MILVGAVSSEEEKTELMQIAKNFVVGQRAKELAQQGRRKNENSNKKKNK